MLPQVSGGERAVTCKRSADNLARIVDRAGVAVGSAKRAKINKPFPVPEIRMEF